ncbi:MAG: hypothetical protein Q9160_003726 [Pyrenula sp. 1 TL-2023]
MAPQSDCHLCDVYRSQRDELNTQLDTKTRLSGAWKEQLDDFRRGIQITMEEATNNARVYALTPRPPTRSARRDKHQQTEEAEKPSNLITRRPPEVIRDDEEHLPIEVVRARGSIDNLLASAHPEVLQPLDARSERRQLQEQYQLESSRLRKPQEPETNGLRAIIVEIESDDDQSVPIPESADSASLIMMLDV